MSGKPIGRERNVVDGEAKVERQGEGLGQGPVGNREGNTGLGGQNRPGPGRPGNQGPRNAPPSAPRPGNGPKEAPQQADKGIISDLLGGGNNSGNNNGGILGGLMGGNNNNTNNNNSGLGGLGGLGGGNNGGYNGGNNGGNGGYNGPSNSVLSGGSTGGSSGGRKGKGKSLILILIIVVVIVVLGSCLIRSCTKRISDGINNLPVNNNTNANTNTNNILPTGFSFNDVSNNYYSTTSWESNAGVLNKEVAAGEILNPAGYKYVGEYTNEASRAYIQTWSMNCTCNKRGDVLSFQKGTSSIVCVVMQMGTPTTLTIEVFNTNARDVIIKELKAASFVEENGVNEMNFSRNNGEQIAILEKTKKGWLFSLFPVACE